MQTLHARDCDVVIHCHSSEQEARALANRLNMVRSDSAHVVVTDLVPPNGAERLAQSVLEMRGYLDIVVNNASRFYPTPIGSVTQQQWDELFGSNLRSPFFLAQALAQPLRDSGGSVINIIDIHADRPMRRHPVYCLAKAGLAMMTRSLARELGPDIRVNGVSPGAILWPEDEPSEAVQEHILERVVMKRLGDPDDIAGAVAFLALDAPYVTGQILAVDGGRSLNI